MIVQLDLETLSKLFGMMVTTSGAIIAANRMFVSRLIQTEFEKFQKELQIITLDVGHKFAELERRFVLAAVHEAKYEHLHDRYEELADEVKYLKEQVREKERER